MAMLILRAAVARGLLAAGWAATSECCAAQAALQHAQRPAARWLADQLGHGFASRGLCTAEAGGRALALRPGPLQRPHAPPSARWQSGGSGGGGAGRPGGVDVGKAQQSLANAVLRGTRAASAGTQGASRALLARLPAAARQALQPGSMQRVLKLQAEAFWGSHGCKVLALGGAVLVYLLWRTLFRVASVFLNLSETMADFGFLALAAALACFAALYARRLYSINPDAVYRHAMLQLNTNPAVLEVMGAPVAGSSVRAVVLTGGGLRLKGLAPRLRSRRVQMIFPLAGPERRGLVSLEAKKLQGRYLFKLLAVDVPSAAGAEQRLFLEGDERLYARGGVIAELRDPFLNALALRREHEAEDERDDAAADAAAAAERRARRAARVGRAPRALDEGGGMYFWERVYWGVRRMLAPRPAPPADEPQPPSGGKVASAGAKAPPTGEAAAPRPKASGASAAA